MERLANLHIRAACEARTPRLHSVRSVAGAPPDADSLASFTLAVGDLAGLDVLADFEAAA
jgi:hypothetical protein